VSRDDPSGSGPGRLWTAALVLVCAGAFWLLAAHVLSSLPYPQHIDEPFVSGPADRMIVEGTLHPYTFVYPSLPRYLAALGMAGGFIRSAANHEIRTVQQIGSVGFPYYQTPGVVATARLIWVFVAVVALALTGISAWLAFRTRTAMVLAPLAALATPLFFAHAWSYLNVDMIGTAFVAATLAACLRSTYRPSIAACAVVPGLLAGLATASKYPLGLVVIAVFATCLLYLPASRWIAAWAAALGAMVAGFVAGVPYCLIDITGFLNGAAQQIYEYAGGHLGAQADPGWPQVVHYTGHFLGEFGAAGLALAVAGAAAAAWHDWRRTAILLVFPAALMWILVGEHVNFTRNVLALQPLIAIFAAYGAVRVHRWTTAIASRRGWTSERSAGWAALGLAFLLAAAVLPPWHVRDAFRDTTDSRTVAQAWIAEHIPPDWTVVVPPELGMDVRPLEARGMKIAIADVGADPAAVPAQIANVSGTAAVVLVPRWAADERYPGRETAERRNELARAWRIVASFGSHPVLVNYTQPVPEGDPAFGIATLEHRVSSPE
jgi:hypothetical protein